MHVQIKYIEIDFHFVYKWVANKELDIKYNTFENQLVNALIKSLLISRFLFLEEKLLVLLCLEFEEVSKDYSFRVIC